jgi:hypothetical protein
MTILKVTVKQSTSKGQTNLEGSYQLPGSSLTKLVKKDGTTRFQNRANLNQTARKLATTLGWELQYQEPAKKAAKKSVKSKTASKPKAKAKSKPKAKTASKPKAAQQAAPTTTTAQ